MVLPVPYKLKTKFLIFCLPPGIFRFLKIGISNGVANLVFSRAVDPHSFNADPDPAVFLNADPDPGPPEPKLKKKS